ncbi:MAG TPA: ABC transporter permease [Acidobacteriota bacterium]
MSPRPPRFTRALLRLLLPAADRDGAVAELDEKFAAHAASPMGLRGARRWYRRQVAGAFHPRVWSRSIASFPEKGRAPLAFNWMQDLRFGLKMLAKSPASSAVIIITLAVGIGFNGAIFSLTNTIILNDIPVEDPGALLFVASNNLSQGRDHMRVSYPDYADLAAASRAFASLAALEEASVNVGDGVDAPQRFAGAFVTASMFDVLRVGPEVGRPLRDADTEPGAEAVALLGYGVWQDRYGGAGDVLGRTVNVNGRPTTVVGVLPPQLRATPFQPDVWLPLVASEELRTQRAQRNRFLVIGRLRDGVTRAEARAELEQLADGLAREHAATNEGVGVVVETFGERFTSTPNRVIVLVMLGAVGFLLLIGCANVANLLIARAAQRGHEVVIRAALGASRRRLIRQLLVESLPLGLLGGAAAIIMTRWSAAALADAILAANPPQYWDFSVRPSVYAFIVLLSLATSVLFGLAPALHLTRAGIARSLTDGGRGTSGRQTRRLTGALVVVQLALAMVLLAGAGVMIRSNRNIQGVDWGLDTDGVLIMRLALTPADYPGNENVIAFHDELRQRLEALPGVDAAALTSTFPGSGAYTVSAELEDMPVSDGHPVQQLSQMIVSPGYFDVAGAAALRGRLFTDDDGLAGDPVILVERRLAERYWPGEEAIGKRLRWVGQADTRWMRVIGVVPDVLQQIPMAWSDNPPAVYTPFKQEPRRNMGLMVRSRLDVESLAGQLRREVQALDPNLPLFDIAPLSALIHEVTIGWRIVSVLFFILGATALFLSSLGIYAVMAFAVGCRRREIGIRMALGARRKEVVGLVAGTSLRQVAIGLVLGFAGALALTRVLSIFMYEVSVTDPLTFGVAVLLLVATALAAGIVPARRASAVDPLAALRSD